MCFSAEASFAGGATLLVIGATTVRKVTKPSQVVFAAIPILFGLQQIAEGFLWISLPNPDSIMMQQVSAHMFLLVSNVLWPSIVPLAIYRLEENVRLKKIMKGFLITGILVSAYYAFLLVTKEVNPQIIGHHIKYNANFPSTLGIIVTLLYIIVTIVPLFMTSLKSIRMFGILMFTSCFITAIFYIHYLTSVWCFFAAIISISIYWVMKNMNRKVPESSASI